MDGLPTGAESTISAVDVHSSQAGESAASYRDYERVRSVLLRLRGHHLSGLAARGFDVTGVAGSPEMLDQARACPNTEL